MSTMTTNDTTADDLEKQAHDAEAQARQLEQRVLDGDEDITPEQISEARSRSGFFRLRAKGKRDREEREAHEARMAAVRAVRDDVLTLAPTTPLRPTSKEAQAAVKTIGAAFAKYLAAISTHDSEVAALKRRALDLGIAYGDELEGLRDQGSSLAARADDGTTWAVEGSWNSSRESAVRQLIHDAMAKLPADDRVRL